MKKSKYHYFFIQEDIHQNHFYFDEKLRNDSSKFSDYITSNSKYFAVKCSKDSLFILPHEHGVYGQKITQNQPKIIFPSNSLNDLCLSPHSNILSTANNSSINLYTIPNEIEFEKDISKSTSELLGHSKNILTLQFHPLCNNVLSSSSIDMNIKLWDLTTLKSGISLELKSVPQFINFNAKGDGLLSCCSDKFLRVFDIRKGDEILNCNPHYMSCCFRCCYLSGKDMVVTTGFNEKGNREIKLWDLKKMDSFLAKKEYSQPFGSFITLYDPDLELLYAAVKGEGVIQYYDVSKGNLDLISEYVSPIPQYGLCMLHKLSVNTLENEVVRFLKKSKSSVISLKGTLPPETPELQEKIFTDTIGVSPANTSEDFFGGKELKPNEMVSLHPKKRPEGFAKQISLKKPGEQIDFENMEQDELLQNVKDIFEKTKLLGKVISELPELRQGDRVIKKYLQRELFVSDRIDFEKINLIEFENSQLKKDFNEKILEHQYEKRLLKDRIIKLKDILDLEKVKYRELLQSSITTVENIDDFSVGTRAQHQIVYELGKKVEVLTRNLIQKELVNRKLKVYYLEKIERVKRGDEVDMSKEDIKKFLGLPTKDEMLFLDGDDVKSSLHSELLEKLVQVDKKREEFEKELKKNKKSLHSVKESYIKKASRFKSKTSDIIKRLIDDIRRMKVDDEKKEKRLYQLRGEYVKLQDKNESSKEEIEKLRTEKNHLSDVNEAMQEDLEKYRDDNETYIEKIRKLEENLEIMTNEKDQITEEKIQEKIELEKLKVKHEKLKKIRKNNEKNKGDLEKDLKHLEEKNLKMKQKKKETIERLKIKFRKQMEETLEKNKTMIRNFKKNYKERMSQSLKETEIHKFKMEREREKEIGRERGIEKEKKEMKERNEGRKEKKQKKQKGKEYTSKEEVLKDLKSINKKKKKVKKEVDDKKKEMEFLNEKNPRGLKEKKQQVKQSIKESEETLKELKAEYKDLYEKYEKFEEKKKKKKKMRKSNDDGVDINTKIKKLEQNEKELWTFVKKKKDELKRLWRKKPQGYEKREEELSEEISICEEEINSLNTEKKKLRKKLGRKKEKELKKFLVESKVDLKKLKSHKRKDKKRELRKLSDGLKDREETLMNLISESRKDLDRFQEEEPDGWEEKEEKLVKEIRALEKELISVRKNSGNIDEYQSVLRKKEVRRLERKKRKKKQKNQK